MIKDSLYSDNWSVKEIDEAKSLVGPILICGSSGFIGAKLFFSLSNVRDDVFATSKHIEYSWRLNNLNNSNLLQLDINNYESVKSFILKYKPKTIFNFAAYGAYSRQKDPFLIHQTNYFGTLNLLQALSETQCDAFVQAGSSSEYGDNCDYADEGSNLDPNSHYSVSKISTSFLIKYFGKKNSFPCINARMFSVYGPWEERDRLIPTLIKNCLNNKYPPFVNKNISRDFVYVDDTTSALVKLANIACKKNKGDSINIATGKNTTIEELAYLSKEIFNLKEDPVFDTMKNRDWDQQKWNGNPMYAKKIIDWEAKTTLTEGLQLTSQWEKNALSNIKVFKIPERTKKISIILACYKDSMSIPILYERIKKTFQNINYEYEILFVNDNSPENDEEAIRNISKEDFNVIGINHSRNFGSQSAFMSGMLVASGDAVVLMDGDGQDPPEIILDFIRKWQEGYDVVYGVRSRRVASLYMQIFYKLFYRIFVFLSDVKIPKDAGDFSLIDKKVTSYLKQLNEKDVFLRGLRAWVGFKQIGIPYVRPERLFGKSTNNFLKNIWWAKKGIFSFSIKPLNYIQLIGAGLFAFSIYLTLYYICDHFFSKNPAPRGFYTIVILIISLTGLNIFAVSIIGDYMGKVLEEVKNRPRFIRRSLLHKGKDYFNDEEINNILVHRK